MSKETVRDYLDNTEKYEQLLEDADRGARTEQAQEFVHQMLERYEEYSLNAFISPSQWKYLNDLANS